MIVSDETAKELTRSIDRLVKAIEGMKKPSPDYERGSSLPLVGCAYCGAERDHYMSCQRPRGSSMAGGL